MTPEYLCGEIRSSKPPAAKYQIAAEDELFFKEQDGIYRKNKIYRCCVDIDSDALIEKICIKTNHAKVLYDPGYINADNTCAT